MIALIALALLAQPDEVTRLRAELAAVRAKLEQRELECQQAIIVWQTKARIETVRVEGLRETLREIKAVATSSAALACPPVPVCESRPAWVDLLTHGAVGGLAFGLSQSLCSSSGGVTVLER